MTEVSQRDLRELADKLGEMSSALSRVEEKISGTDTILSLHLDNINTALQESKDDRESIRRRISDVETQVAKLIGKWSVVVILVAGIVSATVAGMVSDDKMELPIAVLPKTELPIAVRPETERL